MHVGTHNDQQETNPTMLELVLRLHGDFRRRLEPIRVTPLPSGSNALSPSLCRFTSEGSQHAISSRFGHYPPSR